MTATSQPPGLPSVKFLRGLVIVLGVIFIGVAGLFFFLLLTHDRDAAPREELPAVAGSDIPTFALSLGADEEVASIDLEGSSLIVHVKGPQTERILVLSPYTMDRKAVINIERDPGKDG